MEFKVSGFLDDNKQLQSQILLGKTVYSPLKIEKLLKTKNIILVFLALPSISISKRNEIIENLSKYNLTVKTLPSISEIADGRINISDIKDFNINDLLNREEVKPDRKLLNLNIKLEIFVFIRLSLMDVPKPFSFEAAPRVTIPTVPTKGAHDCRNNIINNVFKKFSTIGSL